MTMDRFYLLMENELFAESFKIQQNTLNEFYELSSLIVGDSLSLKEIHDNIKDIQKNFFSTFFLAVTKSICVKEDNLPLYAMVNQCMRAWVTACDNILDDEYKEIFPFDIKEKGDKIRSFFTLMISDRIISNYVMKKYKDVALLEKVNSLSLKALITPALQECSEENRPLPVLEPQKILHEIHKRKTGDLFAATLFLPFSLENISEEDKKNAIDCVTLFGLACQIIDDIKDMQVDCETGGYNYILSLEAERRKWDTRWISEMRNPLNETWNAWERFPESNNMAQNKAVELFHASFEKMEILNLRLNSSQRTAIIELMFELLKVHFMVS